MSGNSKIKTENMNPIIPLILIPFIETKKATLYKLDGANNLEGNTWFGFIAHGINLPDQLSISEALYETEETPIRGSFIFCETTPNSLLVDSLDNFIENQSIKYRGFFWLRNADFTGEGLPECLQLQFLQDGPPYNGKFSIKSLFTYSLKNISILFGTQTTINWNESSQSFEFGKSPSSYIRLRSGKVDSAVDGVHYPVTLPINNKFTGGFQFQTEFSVSGYNIQNDLNIFGVGMQYSANESACEFDQFYNVFGLPETPEKLIYFKGAFHTFYPLNDSQSYLDFIPKEIGDEMITIGTFFRTNHGKPLAVKPLENSAKLVFANDNDSRFYFTLSGDFEWRWPTDSEQTGLTDLLAGLSGTETISITPGSEKEQGDLISFYPDHPAYAPLFPVVSQNPLTTTINPEKLTKEKTTTAWIAIKKVSSAENIYFAQPVGNALYAKGQGVSVKYPKLLGHFPTCSGHLNKPPNPIVFPLVPYAGLNVDNKTQFDNINGFETQILASVRKEIISKSILALPDPGLGGSKKVLSTSPQGLLVQVDDTTCRWDLLQLAKNSVSVLKEGIKTDQLFNLAFNNLSRKLQSAFQTQQQFLVISENKPLDPDDKNSPLTLGKLTKNADCPTPGSSTDATFCNEMSIEGWPFFANVPEKAESGNFKNVVIFKFSSGSLLDRVANTKLWTNPDDFNSIASNGLENLSSWLVNYINAGISKYEGGDTDYQKFHKIATNPAWTGIVVFKAKVGLEDFPEELQGLLGGIDMSLFNAHHFGVDVNFINSDSSELSMEARSSMFGLIDYQDPSFAPFVNDIPAYKATATIKTSVPYDYKVLLLKVLFDNSKIANFNSYLQLVVNELFGEPVLSANRDNLQILKGTYEDHDGTPSYIFNTTEDSLMYLQSAVINKVEAIKVNFSTLLPQQTGDDDPDNVHARFGFFGYIDFNALSGFDLFSFGSPTDTQGKVINQGLSYSNLYIDMEFKIDDANNKKFTFTTEQIAFNVGQSTTREGSLFPHFPLNLRGLTSGEENNTPASQGYLEVEMPDLEQKEAVSTKWYGLTYDLDMGSLGALASDAGFNATFMMMWEVGGTGAAAGIQLPGVNSQSKFFSLQGVLKVTIDTIKLLKGIVLDNNRQPDPSKMAYLMMINDIALKFLSVKIPPNGDIDFYLFGNPDEGASPGSLGWYAAYQKNS